MAFSLEILAKDPKTKARLGRMTTPRGAFETPLFMPVGTRASVRTMSSDEVEGLGFPMILANAYHLYLRPGSKLIREAGGLHKFMSWKGSILTDSGGYQIFSLGGLVKVRDEGAEFRSTIDGSTHFLTPEDVVEIQRDLGSDIMMVLDQCPPYPAERRLVEEAVARTSLWAEKSVAVWRRPSEQDRLGALFGIVQGGVHLDLRERSARELSALDFPGYGIGGLSVGEPRELMLEALEASAENLPQEKPRYLMGVGDPEGILLAVARGVDLFDSVLPTRVARNGGFFSGGGRKSIRNSSHTADFAPLEESCECPVCRTYTRAYLRHLYISGEILALRLLTWHNLAYLEGLVRGAREAIREGTFAAYLRERSGN